MRAKKRVRSLFFLFVLNAKKEAANKKILTGNIYLLICYAFYPLLRKTDYWYKLVSD